MFHWAAGALVVCRSDAFREIGGFDQELYAADEIALSQQLRQWGRQRGLDFVILTEFPLETSSRKMVLYSQAELLSQLFRIMLNPRRSLHDKKRLPIWYDGRR